MRPHAQDRGEPRERSGLMRRALAKQVLALAVSLVGLVVGATPSLGDAGGDTVSVAADTSGGNPQKKESRLYYGGSVGFSLSGRVLWLNIQPLLGYKLTPKLSVGTRLNYQYISDRRYSPASTSLNYGGSLFGRYRALPQLYGLAEFELVSLDLGEERDLVPFLLIGAGYVQPLAPRISLMTEVLVDLLQDERASLYRNQGPRVNVGIGVGY